ncbi:MAG: isoleucine--tRNA ligase [Planctomycetota bacterium]|nr:MAG: isoleucine--tRNA ligase [Planctomycetota bacterium]
MVMSHTQPAFRKVPDQVSFPQLEEAILEHWSGIDAFAQSNQRRQEAGAPEFVFYDGPPFATGTPHYGHLLAGTIKDIVPRYWTMRGYHVPRRFGWDCHGLPIEALAQDALQLAGSAAIKEHGIDHFNEQCRSMVLTYVDEWRRTVSRMGRWVDFDNDYKTMDRDFMESVWWVFRQLWDQGRIYKSHRIMPYSWKLTTPLSNFEANSNYKDVQDPAITVRFRVREGAAAQWDLPSYLLAWTTTPWTLPENLALCVGPDIAYSAIQVVGREEILILASARVESLFPDSEQYREVARLTGSQLQGSSYEPLFPYWQDHANAFRVLSGDFVSTDNGTGIVHLAPAYGEDDFAICRDANIALVDGLDEEARFLPIVTDFAGRHCKEADADIIRWLKEQGKLEHHSTIVHAYPFCERTDTPLIYRAIDAWYVRVEDLRERMVELNEEIRWVPQAVGSGRFGNWLKEARDWNISRNRFWGSCLPLWINEDDPQDILCIGSVAELEALTDTSINDLHKHTLDEIVIERDGKRYRRTPEVLDCWFESGSMPYAQAHFPFAEGSDIGSIFPASFIAEGLDQTRGWFYTLLVLGTALFDRAPYRNVVVNGLILAEDGQKMSKRKKNYPDPNTVIDQYGADALRAYMINSPVVRGQELRFSENGLSEIVRAVVLPYWNALSFFTTYAEVDGFDPRHWQADAAQQRPEADRWILSVLQSLIRDVNAGMEAYRLDTVIPRLVSFIDDLTNWYIRSNRPRFWKTEERRDQSNAFHTLHEVLSTFARVLAPFMPFLTEDVHQRLVRSIDPQAPRSIHWCDYPQVDEDLIDQDLERRTAVIRRVVSLGRKLREEHRLRVRQPLAGATVVSRDEQLRSDVETAAPAISHELNVRMVHASNREEEFTSIAVKPNFKVLRQRCAPKLGQIGKALAQWGFAEVEQLEAGQSISCCDEELGLGDVLLQRKPLEGAVVATDGEISVVLDTTLDDDLRREGYAREVISVLQNARKQHGFAVSDRIRVRYTADQDLSDAISHYSERIAGEILAREFVASNNLEADQAPAIDGLAWRFAMERVPS